MEIKQIKRKRDAAISQLSAAPSWFSKHPEKNFRRNRKLPFRKMFECILTMEGGTLSTELPNVVNQDTSMPLRGDTLHFELDIVFHIFLWGDRFLREDGV